MFIELVDAMRCPVPHEESWLVVSADRMESRHIVEGTLGCPVCHATYPIRSGVVDLSGGVRRALPPSRPSGAEDAMRLAALLGLEDAQGFAVLLGRWGSCAAALAQLVECPIVLVDPPDDVQAQAGVSIIRSAGAIPLAVGAARGMAIDVTDLHGDHRERIDSAIRATRVKGRVVGDAALPVPAGVLELARDETTWVAEREPTPSPLIALHVRRGARG